MNAHYSNSNLHLKYKHNWKRKHITGISKQHFFFSILSKMNEKILPRLGQKFEVSGLFFGKIEDTKRGISKFTDL